MTRLSMKNIRKRKFTQDTSKCLKQADETTPVILHQNNPSIFLTKNKTSGFMTIKVHDDINEPIFPAYDEW